jgi:SAM-dependent MidA family methyltransferase
VRTPATELVRAAIERRGPLPFSEVVATALYDPAVGFYAVGGRAGRRGDFVTSAEVGPLFGAVVARALDEVWHERGQPEVFSVVEAGAGPGSLARAVLAAEPACRRALRYALVETSDRQRRDHSGHLPLERPEVAFARGPDLAPAGPVVVSLAEMPRPPGPCVVLANELLDNLPFDLLERTPAGWHEVRVGWERDHLVEVLVPVAPGGDPDLVAAVGARVPRQAAAAEWVRAATDVAGPGGHVIVLDYASTSEALASRPWHEWVRTYRSHQRGGSPLADLGDQDITCEVAVDQLPPPDRDRSQAEWLRSHGIEELVDEGRRIWEERAGIGDLVAVRGRSRILEADALLDPAGLGAFRVLEWRGR